MPLLKAKAKSVRSWKAMVQGRFPFYWKNRWEFSAKRNNTPAVKARKREYLEGYCLFSQNIPPEWTVSFEFSPELPKIPVKGEASHIFGVVFSVEDKHVMSNYFYIILWFSLLARNCFLDGHLLAGISFLAIFLRIVTPSLPPSCVISNEPPLRWFLMNHPVTCHHTTRV